MERERRDGGDENSHSLSPVPSARALAGSWPGLSLSSAPSAAERAGPADCPPICSGLAPQPALGLALKSAVVEWILALSNGR